MATIIDITDKLNFEEKPQIKIKDITLAINDDAITVLKILSGYDEATPSKMLEVAELLFSGEDNIKFKSLHLNTKDFLQVISTAIAAITGDAQGEVQTPTMT